MALPEVSLRQLLEAGVHFGHHPRRWNPKMAPYIYGVRSKVHILDLQKTAPLLHHALVTVRDVVAAGGRILFVGTKRQSSEPIAEAAKACGQYYVNHRWLGGMLTNWTTISKSITRLEELESQLSNTESVAGLTKKEKMSLVREHTRLTLVLDGIRNMGGKPNLMFVIDTNKESLAVTEAKKLGIPVIGVVDTNSNPDDIDYPIPGNDDASRAIQLYCRLVAASVLDGLQEELIRTSDDVGEREIVIDEAAKEFSEAVVEVAETAAETETETTKSE